MRVLGWGAFFEGFGPTHKIMAKLSMCMGVVVSFGFALTSLITMYTFYALTRQNIMCLLNLVVNRIEVVLTLSMTQVHIPGNSFSRS